MVATAYALGAFGEQLACEFLKQKNYSILEKNYRIRGGEIDIIAQDGNDIVFVEVKLRTAKRFGYPEEAVSCEKLRRIAKAIKSYLHHRHRHSPYIRFDIIAIEYRDTASTIRHIENIELPYDVC
ncbi:MAG: YraN family protein [Patescibacteria group bacterium]